MENRFGPYFYYLSSTGAVLLWSASFIATKLAYGTFAPIQLGAARTLIAAILFWILRRLTSDQERILREDRLRLAASGFLGLTLYFTVENLGVSMTSASNAALIVASFPVVAMLIEYLICRDKPTLRKACGIITALSGVAVLTQITVEGSSGSLQGNLLLLCAGVVWAFYSLISRELTGKYSVMTLTYYQMLTGSVLFIPFLLWEGAKWAAPDFTSLGALLYLSVGCSVAAFFFYNIGLKKLSVSTSISLMNLVPVFGLILAVVILHEAITVKQIFGGIVVIAGVYLSSAQKRSQKDVPGNVNT